MRIKIVGVLVVLVILVIGITIKWVNDDLTARYASQSAEEAVSEPKSTLPILNDVSARELDASRDQKLAESLKSWSGLIRVDVTPKSLEKCISVDKNCSIHLQGQHQTVLRTVPIKNATPKLVDGILTLEYHPGQYQAEPDDETSLDAPVGRVDAVIEIVPQDDGVVWAGDHCFKGSLRIIAYGGKIRVVNVLPLDDYIASVVDSELPAKFSSPGRQAQAIVARSYALYHILTAPSSAVSDVADSTRHQKYLGYIYRGKEGRRFAGETKAGRAIAENTRGIVCVHHGDILLTYFSACCGGVCNRRPEMTRGFSSAYPRHEDPYCEEAPVYRWKDRTSVARFIDELRHVEPKKNWGEIIQGVQKVNSDDAPDFEIDLGKGRRQSISADRLQRAFSLQSPYINVEMKDASVVISGAGHGHGVGLCQWGANFMGQRGKSAEEILSFYYQDIELIRLPKK